MSRTSLYFTLNPSLLVSTDAIQLRPIAAFFARFSPSPTFTYDDTNAPTAEFSRLCEARQWSSKIYKRRKDAFQTAMVLQFNQIYGTNENDIHAWQAIAVKLGKKRIPDTLTECRKVRFHY